MPNEHDPKIRSAMPSAPDDSANTPKVLRENIALISQLKREHRQQRDIFTRASVIVGEFFGSVNAIYLHLLVMLGWISVNTGFIKGMPLFDPAPFAYLSLFACVEAIFLSMFVLIRQNHMNLAGERRSELNLQMGLLTENELTRLIRLNILIAHRLGIDAESKIEELRDLEKHTDPLEVIKQLEKANEADPRNAR